MVSNKSKSKSDNNNGNKSVPDTAAPGWVGGFAESNPAYQYPNPDLDTIFSPGSGKIEQLEREMKIQWPEFSWQTEPGNEKSRCFQMFPPNVSRLGYTKEGEIKAIVCPQQTAVSQNYGPFTVEITVTGQGGWVNESAGPAATLASEVTVEGTIWFSDSSSSPTLFMQLHKYAQYKFKGKKYEFPRSRDTALKVKAHKVGNSNQKSIPWRTGYSERFKPPGFTRHEDDAFTVSNLEFEIGDIVSTKDSETDAFNQSILDLFNAVQLNMLKKGNILTWNVWFKSPGIVDQKEWKSHTEYLKDVVDDLGTKDGYKYKIRKADETEYYPLKQNVFYTEERLVHYTDQANALAGGKPYRREIDMSGNMKIHKIPAPGWIKCCDKDISSMTTYDNMDNIKKLQRQMKVLWPEFSWVINHDQDDEEKIRCYQMFAPDISRLGYTNKGRVYSIICPQQGRYSDLCGTVNIEITVTGQKGWADEDGAEGELMAAELSVVGKIWFGPHAQDYPAVKALIAYAEKNFKNKEYNFPLKKKYAIEVLTHKVDDKNTEMFPLSNVISPRFTAPDFTKHDEAFTVSNLDVQIGDVKHDKYDDQITDFNRAIVNLLNALSGNMLKEGNILTWNVWFEAPTHVCVEEWHEHADKWRRSIEANHGSPGVQESDPKYEDGTAFYPDRKQLAIATGLIKQYVDKGKEIIKGLANEKVNMKISKLPQPGWRGGYVDTNPDFGYQNPDFGYQNPDLSSLGMAIKRSDLDRVERQMRVIWPEFSWLTEPGKESSRVFQRFGRDISRIGYTREGEVISILSPERSTFYKGIGSVNIEVEVTGVRGWVNEEKSKGSRLLAADMSVDIRVWVLEDTTVDDTMVKRMRGYATEKFKGRNYNFPISRETAIIVKTYRVGHPVHEFPLRDGLSNRFEAPDFTKHYPDAFGCCHLDIEIGDIVKTGNDEIDSFNKSFIEILNVAKGNILKPKNVLTWNIWFEAPTLVNKLDWAEHETVSRIRADAAHIGPDDAENLTRFRNGEKFTPEKVSLDTLRKKFQHYTNHINALDDKGINYIPAPHWEFGVAKLDKQLQYPDVDLKKLRNKNPDIKRQMRLLWPELSWRTDSNDEYTRCFQKFLPDISRIGYSDKGVISSLLGPRHGVYSDIYGALNVELTVTEPAGWVEESDQNGFIMAADITVDVAIWFSEQQVRPQGLQALKKYFYSKVAEEGSKYKFPNTKENAIIIETFRVDDSKKRLLPLRAGLSTRFEIPESTNHRAEAWTVSHLDLRIGGVKSVDNKKVDNFNKLILRLFNALKGNMLQEENILTNNFWFEAPTENFGDSWKIHVEKITKGSCVSLDELTQKPKYKDTTHYDSKTTLKSVYKDLEKLVSPFCNI